MQREKRGRVACVISVLFARIHEVDEICPVLLCLMRKELIVDESHFRDSLLHISTTLVILSYIFSKYLMTKSPQLYPALMQSENGERRRIAADVCRNCTFDDGKGGVR